jgi:hypothetical protein
MTAKEYERARAKALHKYSGPLHQGRRGEMAWSALERMLDEMVPNEADRKGLLSYLRARFKVKGSK